MIRRTVLLLALASGAGHVATALKIEAVRTTDLQKEFVALHVKLHSTAVGLREQLRSIKKDLKKEVVSQLIMKFQQRLERILSDTVHIKDKGAALKELRFADGSVNRLVLPYTTWEAAKRSYKLATDNGIFLEANKTASALDRQLSKMEKIFQAKKRKHEQRLESLKIRAEASATKSNVNTMKREETAFNKLIEARSAQFAKMRSAVDAVKKKDPNVLFSFAQAVHDAVVNDDCHAPDTQNDDCHAEAIQ